MCKLAIIPNITDATRSNALKLIRTLSHQMSSHDNHGFGYAAVDENLKLFGERWLKNTSAFKFRHTSSVSPAEVARVSVFRGVLGLESPPEEYNSFGKVNLEKVQAITLHARMATHGDKTLPNTHPFVAENTSLIHNGIIRNHQALGLNKTSNCDSESLLRVYLKEEVNKDPKNIQKLASIISGYYATALFSMDADGKRILDIIRDDQAKLGAAYVKQLNTVIFVTEMENLRAACKALKFTIGAVYNVSKNFLLRFDVRTGSVMERVEFDSNVRSFHQTTGWPEYQSGNGYTGGAYKGTSGYGNHITTTVSDDGPTTDTKVKVLPSSTVPVDTSEGSLQKKEEIVTAAVKTVMSTCGVTKTKNWKLDDLTKKWRKQY